MDALLKTGKHTVTAITRTNSNNNMPEGVHIAKVDYAHPPSLVDALRGQDSLIITMSTMAPKDQEMALIEAAAEAEVPFVLPNEWSPDTAHEDLIKDVALFKSKAITRKAIIDAGKSAYLGIATGFWYEWSLAIPDSYGFDLINKTVTFFDDGEAKISTSTWAQVGRAVAALLSLPIQAEGSHPHACLDQMKNRLMYVNSFTVSQKDMFQSVLRVTETQPEEWKITNQPSAERYAAGARTLQDGDRTGFIHMMYTRVFYPDGSGDFESSKGTLNSLLDLPREDIDEATRVAVERAKINSWS